MIADHHAQVVASPEAEVQDPAADFLVAAEVQDLAVDVRASKKQLTVAYIILCATAYFRRYFSL
jgi:hypothetical protein